MEAARAGSLALRFAMELAMLGALGWWGFASGGDRLTGTLLGIGAPVIAALLWGRFVAPKSTRRLPDPARMSLEVVLFAAAVAALVAIDRVGLAIALGILAAVSIGLTVALDQR